MRGAVVVGVAGLAVLASGCSASTEPAARSVAAEFAAAVSGHDGAAACLLLAPGTRSELEQSSGHDCGEAILGEDLPPAGTAEHLASFGTMAQVRFENDVMFVTRFPTGWRVMAAGCTPVAGHPYDCVLQGG